MRAEENKDINVKVSKFHKFNKIIKSSTKRTVVYVT